jgi:hypothetical protein
MIRDGDTDPQSARPRGNHLYSVAAIGVTGMKMHIKNGMVFAQKQDIRFFKKYFVALRHEGVFPLSSWSIGKNFGNV